MPKLNKNLIRSLVQDLKSLEETCNELYKCVQISDSVSWRYPSQMCYDVRISSILSHCKGSAYECYLLILELMYDRFQYFLHLVISYLDMVPIPSQEIDLPRNVMSPEYLSTGAQLNMLWTRIQMLQRCILEFVVQSKQTKSGKNSKNVTLSLGAVLSNKISAPTCHQLDSFSRNTQTENCALIKCESCCISEHLVQLIVNEIQTQCTEYKIQSLLSHERENMKEETLHATQWKAMTEWSETAKKDLKKILQALNEQIHHNRELEKSLNVQKEEMKEQFAHKNKEICNLERNVYILQTQLQDEKSHVNRLAKEKEHRDQEVKSLRESVKKLDINLRISDNSLNQTSQKNSIMDTALKNISRELGLKNSNCEEYGNISEQLKNFISSSESMKNGLQNKLIMTEQQLQNERSYNKTEVEKWNKFFEKEKEKQDALSYELEKMSECRSQCEDLKLENEHLQLSLKEAERSAVSLLKSKENLEKELQQKKINEQLLLEYPDLNTPIEIKVHGNPAQDMENQIEANKLRSKLLLEQNIKLEETLGKLKKITKLQWGI